MTVEKLELPLLRSKHTNVHRSHEGAYTPLFTLYPFIGEVCCANMEVTQKMLQAFVTRKDQLRSGRFYKAKMPLVSFRGLDLTWANFQKADLRGAQFTDCILDRADFGGAELSQADFSNASLNRTNFSGANLTEANFFNTDMGECWLQRANLTGAWFNGATSKGKKLTAAHLRFQDTITEDLKGLIDD